VLGSGELEGDSTELALARNITSRNTLDVSYGPRYWVPISNCSTEEIVLPTKEGHQKDASTLALLGTLKPVSEVYIMERKCRSGAKKAYYYFFESGSHCVAQAGLKLRIFLSQPPKCWDYRFMPPCPI
jgi:hypothetical protein